jgi:hypothetical protein
MKRYVFNVRVGLKDSQHDVWDQFNIVTVDFVNAIDRARAELDKDEVIIDIQRKEQVGRRG